MLKQLYIRNFTLIDELDITLESGFSVITGETGAGKSIILGAIALLLGQRADAKLIKEGAERCVVEAYFDIGRYDLQTLFQENDIDYDADDCILRREITASGKSRAFVNDTPVALSVMKTLGPALIDIHSQHRNLLLREEDFQLGVVDIMAGNAASVAEYREAYNALTTARKELEQLKESMSRNAENEDYMRFQLDELQKAELQEGLQEELERESEMLGSVEDIKGALFSAGNMLEGNGERSVADSLKEAARALDGIAGVYDGVAELAERLGSCVIELEDISRDIARRAEVVEFDPERLEYVNSRLDSIYSLQKKHHVSTVEELISIEKDLETRLARIDNGDEELQRMTAEVERAEARCVEIAALLTKQRMKAAAEIEKEMKRRLVPLGIPKVRFCIAIDEKPLSQSGADRVSFLFSANTSTEMRPVSEVASGGEIARVMLSVKAMISGAVKLPTVIFDEIDTGVSGKIAEQMGHMMQEMAGNDRQVVSITHLPQIAARGKNHYKVYKEETRKGTVSNMTLLSEEERVNEIAQMLSGSDITEAAVNNATELLNRMRQ
ncbi:MAG: DNA repair protein RecN [Prevotella sp.]|uniref:DNA repair protein RecN n=1 Tax=Prevotella sp. TaxID=59823 RepID=UPI002A25AA4A|nr:DNA repair protein RecN [Prevotella sp.]MDD7318528.1 DNA repair protein RecN [Prevotellaceae bacterium]MDY4020329.1 DNA repair protein RecN [Prevotella sp.]